MFFDLIKAGAVSTFVLFSSTAHAQGMTEKADTLYNALGLAEIVSIMQEEGKAYGEELANEFFPGRELSDWPATVDLIYDVEIMNEEVRGGFLQSLDPEHVDAILDFITSDDGQKIIELEISARRTLMDEEIEELAKENAAIAMQDETARFLLIRDFVETNDIVEENVVGAMNSNFAFYMGMVDGGALGDEVSQEQILADVWGQEDSIRTNTTEWAYTFLMMAYQPLQDAEIETYTNFSNTEPGEAMNEALFAAFDTMLERVSYDLGRAIGLSMLEQEL